MALPGPVISQSDTTPAAPPKSLSRQDPLESRYVNGTVREGNGGFSVGISDLIANFILNVMREADGVAELQRNELAQRFNCVPSQINYVIATRFSPEHGYIVESRRGGGGYLRISRVPYDKNTLGMHAINSIGDSVDASTARAILNNLLEAGVLQERDVRLICAATDEKALRAAPAERKNLLRASILKQLLVQILL